MSSRDMLVALERTRCTLFAVGIALKNANESNQNMSNVIGTNEGYTMDEIRAFEGQEDNVFYVTDAPDGRIAYYNPQDTTSPDDGSSVLVDGDGRRYYLLTVIEIFNQLSKSWNIWDII